MIQPTAIHFDAYRNQLEVAFADGRCQRIDAQHFYPDKTKTDCHIAAIEPDEQLVVQFTDGQSVTLSWQAVYDLMESAAYARTPRS